MDESLDESLDAFLETMKAKLTGGRQSARVDAAMAASRALGPLGARLEDEAAAPDESADYQKYQRFLEILEAPQALEPLEPLEARLEDKLAAPDESVDESVDVTLDELLADLQGMLDQLGAGRRSSA